MEIFYSTLRQMLVMFTFIILGYVLRKGKILPLDSDKTMSRLETYIFVPALTLYTQMTKCTVKTFTENSELILYGTIIVVSAMIVAYPLSRLFIRRATTPRLVYTRNVYKYAMTFSNYGFMGNFIALGVFGEEFFYKYSLFSIGIAIFCSSWGLYTLIPKEQNAGILKNLKKGLLTPPILALVTGIIFGLLDISKYVPDFLITVFNNAGNCQGPVAMVLAGFVIGGYSFKGLITDKKVYVATALRLIVIPSVMLIILNLFGVSKEIMTLTLIAFATPLGLNTIVYPAAYGGETETGASMAMISHTLSVVTIPLMYFTFIVWM